MADAGFLETLWEPRCPGNGFSIFRPLETKSYIEIYHSCKFHGERMLFKEMGAIFVVGVAMVLCVFVRMSDIAVTCDRIALVC